ncbi:hypothetical protein GCM10011344_00250 [Dokdonia pacifica]|nr:hypothetical protein GCM10011344_00250 [Dokdonia pacifica]
MDTLTQLTKYNRNQKYDSIAKVTISNAIALDAVNLATKHLGELLYYQNNRIGKPKEALELFKDFLEKNRPVTDTLILAKLYLEGADAHLNSGLDHESLSWYDKTMTLALKAKDSSLYAKTKGYKAFALTKMGDFATASQEYQKALTVFIKRKDTSNIIRIRGGLSIIYGQNNFYEECQKELDAIENLAKASNNIPAYLISLGNKATNYYGQKKYKESIEVNKKKLQLIEKHPRFKSMESSSFKMLILSYIRTDSLAQAKTMLKKLEAKINPSDADFDLKRKYSEALAEVYLAEKKYTHAKNTAIDLFEMLKTTSNYSAIMDNNNLLSRIEEKLGNTGKSLEYYKKYTSIKDSIESVQKVNALAYYQTLYETEKRDFKIATQQNEITLLDQKNKVKQQWLLFGGISLLVVFTMIYLVRRQKFIRSKKQLQEQFSQGLINEQEKERTRLARELHDSVGQKLMLLSKNGSVLGDKNAKALAGNTLEELRSISRSLYPPALESLGLSKAIESLINEIDANTTTFFTHEITPIDHTLPRETTLHVYRIIQETLSNMIKHAEAKVASVTVSKKEKSIEVVITDNGKGFLVEEQLKKHSSLGMKTLIERAKIIHSKLNIVSDLDKGTKIQLSIPL